MKSQFITLATVLAFSGGAFAQSATDGSSGSSNSSYGSTPSANCESLTGAEKTQCMRDQAGSQNSRPSEVPASTSTGASPSTDSTSSDSSSSSGGTSDSSTSSSPSTGDTSTPKD